MCRLRNSFAAVCVTTKKMFLPARHTDRRTDRQTPDKVIPMCRYMLRRRHKNHSTWKKNDCSSVFLDTPSFAGIYSVPTHCIYTHGNFFRLAGNTAINFTRIFDIQHTGSYFTLKIKHIFVIRSSGRLERKDGPSNMSCHVKYSARITKRVASVQRTDIFRLAHVNYTYKKHQEDDIIST